MCMTAESRPRGADGPGGANVSDSQAACAWAVQPATVPRLRVAASRPWPGTWKKCPSMSCFMCARADLKPLLRAEMAASASFRYNRTLDFDFRDSDPGADCPSSLGSLSPSSPPAPRLRATHDSVPFRVLSPVFFLLFPAPFPRTPPPTPRPSPAAAPDHC